jgi:phenylpyruvate tautomerase PptA (4-oxalocrotonate tautomerase family)
VKSSRRGESSGQHNGAREWKEVHEAEALQSCSKRSALGTRAMRPASTCGYKRPMAQIKIYGLKSALDPIRAQLSDVIHAAAVQVLAMPADKRFHRFFGLETDNFIFPPGRSNRYTIIEISMFEGRSTEAKKNFICELFRSAHEELGLEPNDLEITISETPRANWGIRGACGDELELGYKVEI